MAETNFDACIDVVLVFEGGLSMTRADSGNWTGGKVGRGQLRGTNYGIAASAHPTLDIANLTRDGAKTIYRSDYWNKIGGDALPAGVDLVVMDSAVNSGPSKALRWLAAARAHSASPAVIIKSVCDQRLSFDQSLSSWRTFGKGWSARIASVEAKAQRMVLGEGPAASAAIGALGADHATKAKSAQHKLVQAALTGSLAAGGTAAYGGHAGLVIFTLLAGIAVAAAFAFVAWRNGQRATALAAEATKPSLPLTPVPKV